MFNWHAPSLHKIHKILRKRLILAIKAVLMLPPRSYGDLPKRQVQAGFQPHHATVSQRTPAGFYAGGHQDVYKRQV